MATAFRSLGLAKAFGGAAARAPRAAVVSVRAGAPARPAQPARSVKAQPVQLPGAKPVRKVRSCGAARIPLLHHGAQERLPRLRAREWHC